MDLSDCYWATEDEDILMELTLVLGGTVIRPLSWRLPTSEGPGLSGENGVVTEDQKKFNKEVSKVRIISEHAFGLIKEAWRV